jgi:hypothetical protein
MQTLPGLCGKQGEDPRELKLRDFSGWPTICAGTEQKILSRSKKMKDKIIIYGTNT